MVSLQQVEGQLKRVGCNFRAWGRAEIRELCNVLMPEERIAQAVNGTYEGGFAMLCVTNYRVLLIDRKPMLLTIEDVRYDMISEVDYNNRVLGATLRVYTPMRNLVFNSWSSWRLRKCANYVQQRVMELRQHGLIAQQMQGQMVGAVQDLHAGSDGSDGGAARDTAGTTNAAGRGAAARQADLPVNPYTKTPLLTRRRRFPSFY